MKSTIPLCWTVAGAVLGAMGTVALQFVFLQSQPIASVPAQQLAPAASSLKEELKVTTIEVGLDVRKSMREKIEKDIHEMRELNSKGGRKKQLVGQHISVVAPYFKTITGIWLTTRKLTLWWDGSSEVADDPFYITIEMPEFTIVDVGTAS